MSKKSAQIVKKELEEILLSSGATEFEVDFFGEGDSGEISNLTVYKKKVKISLGVESHEKIMELLFEVVSQLRPGFELNLGGRGSLFGKKIHGQFKYDLDFLPNEQDNWA